MDWLKNVLCSWWGGFEDSTRSSRDSQDWQKQAESHRRRNLTVRHQPVLQNARVGAPGGVQGLNWYAKNMKLDQDGDVADEFLEEAGDQVVQVQQDLKVLSSSSLTVSSVAKGNVQLL
eukprot:jgi/Botrbrau1/10277/Bobra.0140s0030.1